jgi:DNA polymerase III subunit alpha
VIEYVKRKYGRENVAQIITFGSLGAKTVIRDVGRVLEIPFAECDQLAKMVPEDPKMTLKKALEEKPGVQEGLRHRGKLQAHPELRAGAGGALPQPRHPRRRRGDRRKPLIEIVPLARDKDGEPVTQYAMEPLGESACSRWTSWAQDAHRDPGGVDLVRETRGVELDIDLDERCRSTTKTYELLNRGDTVGVFQLESGACAT